MRECALMLHTTNKISYTYISFIGTHSEESRGALTSSLPFSPWILAPKHFLYRHDLWRFSIFRIPLSCGRESLFCFHTNVWKMQNLAQQAYIMTSMSMYFIHDMLFHSSTITSYLLRFAHIGWKAVACWLRWDPCDLRTLPTPRYSWRIQDHQFCSVLFTQFQPNKWFWLLLFSAEGGIKRNVPYVYRWISTKQNLIFVLCLLHTHKNAE